MNDPYALKIQQLTVNYDKTPVLWDINLEIPAGQLVGIVGPNGAGKSTLLKAIFVLIRPLSGKVEFLGKPLKKVRKSVAYVPQRTSVDWDFPITVLDVVLMGLYADLGLLKWPKETHRKAALFALERVGMDAFSSRQISQLSGGQQQRVFLARAIVQDAEIYLMDEPFAGVDAATEKAIIGIMEELKHERKSLFIVHHDLNTVESYFDWLIMLNTCLVASGPIAEVFNSEYVLRTYGQNVALLDVAARLAQNKASGISQ